MNYWPEFLAVAGAHLLAVASPGPDFAVVLRQSLRHGRAVAVWTSVGIGTAILLHVTYSLLGLGFLIKSSAAWFNAVKYAGALYLAWIGIQALRAKPRSADTVGVEAALASPSAQGAFFIGFLTNALNPKATLFFLSLFVLVVSPRTPRLLQIGYGVWMTFATMAWFSFVSVVFTRPSVRTKFLQHGHWIDRVLGVVFLGFSLSLVLASSR